MILYKIILIFLKHFTRTTTDKGIILVFGMVFFFSVYQFLTYFVLMPVFRPLGMEYSGLPLGLITIFSSSVFVIAGTAYYFYQVHVPKAIHDFPISGRMIQLSYNLPFFIGMVLFCYLQIGFIVALIHYFDITIALWFFLLGWLLLVVSIVLLALYTVVITMYIAAKLKAKLWVEMVIGSLLGALFIGIQLLALNEPALSFFTNSYWTHRFIEGDLLSLFTLIGIVCLLVVLSPGMLKMIHYSDEDVDKKVKPVNFSENNSLNAVKFVTIDILRNKDKRKSVVVSFLISMAMIMSLVLLSPVHDVLYIAFLLSVFGVGLSHAILIDPYERAYLYTFPINIRKIAFAQYFLALALAGAFHILLLTIIMFSASNMTFNELLILVPYTIFIISLGILLRYLFSTYGNIGETAFSLVTVSLYIIVVLIYEILKASSSFVHFYTGGPVLLLLSYAFYQLYKYKLLSKVAI